MIRKIENPYFMEELSEGIIDNLTKKISGFGRRITKGSDPTMLAPIKQRNSQYPKARERKITPLSPDSPESKVREGGTSIMRPDLVRKIWTKKKVEPQQKEFFVSVFSKDPEAVAYLKKGIKNVLCGNVELDSVDFTQLDSTIIQFVNAGIIDPVYKDLSKKVYNILYGKSKSETSDLAGFCQQLTEVKSLYRSLLELGPSAQGLGSYDERFEIETGIDRAEESGLLDFSDNINDNDDCESPASEVEIDLKISP